MIIKHPSGIEAEVILGTHNSYDSMPPVYTYRVKFHRFVAEQLLKHRRFSCNAVSSRALSVPKMNAHVEANRAMPTYWGAQTKGMQPSQPHQAPITKEEGVWGSMDMSQNGLSPERLWKETGDYCMQIADAYWDAGYHQQIPNRLTHAFQMAEYIITATEFENFFNLRLRDKAAQSEINILADCMHKAKQQYTLQEPVKLAGHSWHLPYILTNEVATMPINDLLTLSAARCAIISYNNHDTEEKLPLAKAKKIYKHLLEDTNPHLTPCEHSARLMSREEYQTVAHMMTVIGFKDLRPKVARRMIEDAHYFGNLKGWCSQRYLLETCQLGMEV